MLPAALRAYARKVHPSGPPSSGRCPNQQGQPTHQEEAGTLEVGRRADFVILDPERGWKVEDKTLKSKSKNSPFDGRPVQGRVMQTIIDGRLVFQAVD